MDDLSRQAPTAPTSPRGFDDTPDGRVRSNDEPLAETVLSPPQDAAVAIPAALYGPPPGWGEGQQAGWGPAMQPSLGQGVQPGWGPAVQPGWGPGSWSYSHPGWPAASSQAGLGAGSIVPSDIKRWNWGAFLLNWIWAFGNGVTWAGVVGLVAWVFFGGPLVGVPLAIYLGLKGSELSWQNKPWRDLEHFKDTQRSWTVWGVVLAVIGVATAVFIAILVITADTESAGLLMPLR